MNDYIVCVLVILLTVVDGDINISTTHVTISTIDVSTTEHDSWSTFTIKDKIICVLECVQGDAHTIVYAPDSYECVCIPYPVLGLLTMAPTLSVEVMITNSKY